MLTSLVGVWVAFLAMGAATASAQTAEPTLDVYFVDVEGGQATLFVSPSGESMLIDAGLPASTDATPNASLRSPARPG
jgi:beta-lactamase superfamily II metal-dependent hydrolase